LLHDCKGISNLHSGSFREFLGTESG
jgi:hypothetical protein